MTDEISKYLEMKEELLHEQIMFKVRSYIKKFGGDLGSNLSYLRELIRFMMNKFCVHEYIKEDNKAYINEILAYSFIIRYGLHKDSNIHKYYKGKEMELINELNNIDYVTNDLYDGSEDYGRIDRTREKEKLLREGKEQYMERLKAMGAHVPEFPPIEHIRQGRAYDRASMVGLDNHIVHDIVPVGAEKKKQKYTLFDLLFNKNICDSHSVTADEIACAYDHFNSVYEKAKKITEKKEYIDYWVDFSRLEYRLNYTLISKIADYMIKEKIKEFPIDLELADVLWHSLFINGTYVSEACSILNYNILIPYYFTHVHQRKARYIANLKRYHETLIIHFIAKVAGLAFAPFFMNDEKAIEIIYKFCMYDFPVINSHEPICLYTDKEHKNLNHKKIKLIRKIFNVITSPKEIKEFYHKKGV